MIPWGGIGCCLSAAALYVLGRSSGRDADVLKSITKVAEIKDLAYILDTASKIIPLIVSISGRVGSDSPIICEQSGLRGVIVEQIHEQHFLKHNDAGSWIQDSTVMINSKKDTPWYLDDGTGRAFIVEAGDAAGLVLTIASETFEESGRSLVRGTLDYLQGLKMLGLKKTERALLTGTALTVVGEAVKDDIGTLRIQKPHKGPFYVSPNGIDQLIENLGKWARCYKFASGGLAVVGVFLLARHAFYYVLERRRRHELQKRVQAAAAQRQSREAEALNGSSEEVEDIKKKDRLILDICVICLEQEYNAVFVPCGHMCCCIACSSHLSNCPLCRRRIDQVVKTFRH
ncbi:E3 Ubiquitin ligase family protein isoform X2 [Carex rostrata]